MAADPRAMFLFPRATLNASSYAVAQNGPMPSAHSIGGPGAETSHGLLRIHFPLYPQATMVRPRTSGRIRHPGPHALKEMLWPDTGCCARQRPPPSLGVACRGTHLIARQRTLPSRRVACRGIHLCARHLRRVWHVAVRTCARERPRPSLGVACRGTHHRWEGHDLTRSATLKQVFPHPSSQS